MSSSDAIAEGRPGHGSGTAAAELVGAAAALAERVASASVERWADAAAAGSAAAARVEADALAAENRDAYASAVSVLAEPEDNLDVGLALGRTLLVLRRIGTLAADVAELCETVAEHGEPDLAPDAACGAVFASSAARVAAHLVTINLITRPDDETPADAVADAERAAEAAEAAVAFGR
jgi:formiminotetrahydrofolate cyclodeaminase